MSEVIKMGLKELDYKELLLLASNSSFYKTIVTREDVVEYLNAIHLSYCKLNNIKSVKIEISSDLADNTYGAYNYNDRKIYINSKFLEMFYDCKDENNSYYPYALISTIVHESRHLWQHQNIKLMFKEDTSNKDKLSLYSLHKKMHEVKETKKIKLPKKQKSVTTIADALNVSKIMFLGFEFEIEYSNCPCELDAEEEVLKAFMYIFSTTRDKNILNIMLNYADKIRLNDGLWFLSHEYYEDKDKPYDKKALDVIKSVYMSYLKKSLDEHSNGNHHYHEEEYVISLYETLNKIIDTIKEHNYKVPELSADSYRVLSSFTNKPKNLISSR